MGRVFFKPLWVCAFLFLSVVSALPGEASADMLRHKVKDGDTLYSIGSAYGVSVRELRRANRLRGDTIKAGRTLRIPGQREAGRGYDQEPEEASCPPAAVSEKTETREASEHTVKRGETVYSISRKYGVTIEGLVRANNLGGYGIEVGQTLRVPVTGARAITVAKDGDDVGPASETAAPALSSENPGVLVDDPDENEAVDVVEVAKSFEGTPYRFGGNGPDGFDCSGFVKSVFESAGFELPRTAREQFTVGEPVDKEDLERGDLVFFRTYARYPSHVGIYMGDGSFIHMSSQKNMVEITELEDKYYTTRYLGARRMAASVR